MRRVAVLAVLFGVLLVLGNCAPASSTSTPQVPSSAGADLGEYLLVKLAGSLGYKQPGWKQYVPLSFGIALKRGDLLQVAQDAEGLIVCSDLSLAPLPSGYQGGLPCSEAKPVLKRGESLVLSPQRGAATSASTPYILSPRHTFILTPFPILRWAATGSRAAPYVVHVWGGDVDWTTKSTQAELSYPEDGPPLQPGVTYRLTVTDASGRSSEEEGTALDLGFVLLPPDQRAAVQALLVQARGLGLDERATHLMEAGILASYGLRADAIAVLEPLTSSDGAPTVWHRLGDLRREVGLYSEAESAYRSAQGGFRSLPALTAGSPGGDKAGEAAALAGLGLAQRGNSDETAARDSLRRALQLYQFVGDSDGAQQVEKLLTELGGP